MAICVAGVVVATGSALTGGGFALAATPSGGTITQVTVSPAGETEGSGNGRNDASVSNDGRYIVYWTYSPSVVADDDNGMMDVFLYDATTGVTRLIDRNAAGRPGDRGASQAVISANGKFVAFTSASTDLVGGALNPADRIYRYTVATGKITVVSKRPNGKAVSGVFPAISADGRYVSYNSYDEGLVTGDTNGTSDVFRYDAALNQTIRVSRTLSGQQTEKPSNSAVISGNGRYVAWATSSRIMGPADTNFKVDAYVTDTETGTTRLVSHDATGAAVGGTATGVSDNGQYVALYSESDKLAAGDTDTLSGAFLWNGVQDKVILVSVARPEWPTGVIAAATDISSNGRYLAYDALQNGNLTKADVYLYDRTTKQSAKISVRPDGTDANGGSGGSSLSRNGNHIGFGSNATDLVSGDPYGNFDIFVWTRDGA